MTRSAPAPGDFTKKDWVIEIDDDAEVVRVATWITLGLYD
jgi:hypothetical protein